LIEDLKAVGKHVYFWNFRKEPFHIMARYNRDNIKLFKEGKSLCDFVGRFEDNQIGSDKC
jgi:hypothetical protein